MRVAARLQVKWYDVNTDYTERTFIELETQKEPTVKVQNKISQAIADFETDS